MIFPQHKRKRLSSEQRMRLYVAECDKARDAGQGSQPICNLCRLPVWPGQTWDVSHDAHMPRAMGGNDVGIAHARCNRRHGCEVVTPLMAKMKRIRKKHLDIHRTRQPLPGGRDDDRYRKLDGTVVLRATGERA